MIKTIRYGKYFLFQAKNETKLLQLGNRTFSYKDTEEDGIDLAVSQTKSRRSNKLIRSGYYRIYEVYNELFFSDNKHLEFSDGKGHWKAYLLQADLPRDENQQCKMFPTEEVISAPSVRSIGIRKPAL